MQTATPKHLVEPIIICCSLLSCSEKEGACSRSHALTELNIKSPFHRITEWLRLEAHLEAIWSNHPCLSHEDLTAIYFPHKYCGVHKWQSKRLLGRHCQMYCEHDTVHSRSPVCAHLLQSCGRHRKHTAASKTTRKK